MFDFLDVLFDALFDALAYLLALYYSLWNNYGFAIILFTLTVMLVLTPLTFRTTRSMLRMQDLQPQVKRIQQQFPGDRQAMNEELMRLYRKENVSPLGSCLPILVQLPVFFILFRLIRGLTRRTSDLGASLGWRIPFGETESVATTDFADRTFNPEYLANDSTLYVDLAESTEMNFLGFDLSISLLDAFRDSFVTSLPFVLLIVLIGVTSYVQQRQIAGRRDPNAPVNPQQQMIMRIMPWFLPIISLGFPAAMNVYFVSSNLVRVGQQAVITHRIYRPHKEAQAHKAVTDETTEPEPVPEPSEGARRPAALGGRSAPAADHGTRRPTNRKPPRRVETKRATPAPSSSRSSTNDRRQSGTSSTRKQPTKPARGGKAANEAREPRQSSRTTQPGERSHDRSRRRQKKKRR